MSSLLLALLHLPLHVCVPPHHHGRVLGFPQHRLGKRTTFLRADYAPTFTQRTGVTDPLRPRGPSLRPTQGPDVRLPKIVTFRRGDPAASSVIGPLTKTRRTTIKVHGCVEASAWSLRCGNVGHNQPFTSMSDLYFLLGHPKVPALGK